MKFAQYIHNNKASLYKPWWSEVCSQLEDGLWKDVLSRPEVSIYKEEKNTPKGIVNLYQYISNNSDFIDYPAYRSKGYFVGSGAIESGNKTVLQERLNEAISLGHKPKIEKDIRPYIISVREANCIVRYEINDEKLQAAMDKKGFSALAADSNYGAFETLSKYDLRDKSEKQYMVIKTQLGNRVFRTYFTNGVKSKGSAAFIASVIRNEMERICKETGCEFTLALREANFLCVQRTPDNTYMGVHNANSRQINLMSAAKRVEDDIDYFALMESRRINGDIHDQVHKLPSHKNSNEEKSDKRKPGRPLGTTKEQPNGDVPLKRKRGRPPGSKNKPKQTEQVSRVDTKEAKQNLESPRKRGRPPGSKNKKPAVNAKAKRNAEKQANEAAQ